RGVAPRWQSRVQASWRAGSGRHLKVDSLGALAPLVGLGVERHPHALVERPDARALNGGHMDEYVLAALVRRNKAETFGLIEELDSPSLPHARSPCPRSGGVRAQPNGHAPK